jgi:hypothetical protein
MIARMWRGWVRTDHATAYVGYIAGTGLRDYAATDGNLGSQMWTRDLGEGRTDDEYLVDRETTVRHYEVPQSLTP